MIERLETDFSIIHESANGKEALDNLMVENYDLVITDIKMPQMDGITLIKHIQNLKRKPKLVILSGYEDFNYAREAIEYGAKAYLLKPIKRNELQEVLIKIEKEIKEEEFNLDADKIATHLEQLRSNQLNYILLNNKIEECEVEQLINAVSLEIFKAPYCLAQVIIKDKFKGDLPDANIASLNAVINQYLKDKPYKIFSFIDPEGNLVLVLPNFEFLENIANYINEHHRCKYVVIGVSDVFHEVKDIRTAYRQTTHACKYRLSLPENLIIYHSNINELRRDFQSPSDLVKKISQMVGMEKYKEIDNLLSKIFDSESIKSYDVEYIEQTAEYFKEYLIKYFNRIIPQKSHYWANKYDMLNDLYNFSSLQDYIHKLREYIGEVNEYLHNLQAAYQVKNDIDLAVQYINKNYNKDLNMATVANYVSLNYTYFSHLFKENTGVSFVDYLKNIRIEKAKDLLKNSCCKVYEVAQMVGYPNSKQFTKIFGEITGISPIEYRNRFISKT